MPLTQKKELDILPLKVKQRNNAKWADIDHIISHPFTMNILAPSRSGKSVVITNLLYNKDFNFKKRFDKIIFISPTILIDPSLEFARDDEDIIHIHEQKYLDNLDSVIENIFEKQKEDPEESTLLIIDDALLYLRSKALMYATTRNRHYNLSIIISSQAYKKIDPVIRNNATHWLLFKTHTQKEQDHIEDDFNGFPDFLKFYKDAVATPYSFLFADMLKMRLFKRFETDAMYDKVRDHDKYK
jgi:hypothetical protein